ncbi:MAG: 2-hydroxyacid dehydrogenase [Deltaproteobacteria bacterium]|nr:2-hydroxyacid dehydrogenase [Deltaproteobacteria bacterium]
MKVLLLGDAMIPVAGFEKASAELKAADKEITAVNWETDPVKLQDRRLIVEKQGPAAEPVLPEILAADKGTEMLLTLFAPISAAAMDALPDLRLVGAARAGQENLDVAAATERGIVMHNIMGRNAHAVSDFAIGLLFAEARNIARSHYGLKTGEWRKKYSNSDFTPEITGKTLGLIGFGYIGRLVAQKLAGFRLKLLVYDPFVPDEALRESNVTKVSLEDLFRQSDFISLHARMTDATKGLIGKDALGLMKPTAILINTARAGLIDEDALYDALKDKRIGGAALDVHSSEPLQKGSRWLELDNVTLTAHIAGTTAEALTNSPFLLVDDINKLLTGEKPQFILNPGVLEHPKVKAWLSERRKAVPKK